jgi:hypothetical protein
MRSLHLRPRPARHQFLERPWDRFGPYDGYVEYTAASWALLTGQSIKGYLAMEIFNLTNLLDR